MKKNVLKVLLVFACCLVFASCGSDDSDSIPSFPDEVSISTNFESGADGWSADFADYPVGEEQFYELNSGIASLPAPLDVNKKGYMITGINHSDDLFMFIKRKITGLQPNTNYLATLSFNLASNAPSNAIGVGGAPGEGVWVKYGFTTVEPLKVATAEASQNSYRMNIDIGAQSNSGNDSRLLGHIANGNEPGQLTFVNLAKSNASSPYQFTTDSNGEAWVYLSTDSGYESVTTVYYNSIEITLRK